MNRRSWPWMLVAVALALTASMGSRAATEVADGQKLNPAASGVVHWTRRSVDSTGTTAGRVDSAVIVYPARDPGHPTMVGGIYRADTSSRAFSMNSTGALTTADETAPPWGTFTAINAINDTVSIGATPFAAESTVSFPMRAAGYTWCAVYVDVKHAAGDTSVTWIALEPRAGATSAQDSISMAVWPQFGTAMPTGSVTGVAVQDTTTGDFFRSYGSTIVPAAGTGQKAWTGEKVMVFWPTRGNGSEPAISYWGYPRQKYVEIKGPAGDWLSALYMSFRVRILYGPAAASKVRVVLHVVMGS